MLTSTVFWDLSWAIALAMIVVVIRIVQEELDSHSFNFMVAIPTAIIFGAGSGYFTLSAAVRAFTPVIMQGAS